MNNRFIVSFLATTVLYAGLGYFLFYFSQNTSVSDKKSLVKTIELCLQAYQPPVIEKKLEPAVEKTPPPEEKPQPPEPKVEKTIEVPKPKPLSKKEEIKKPEAKKPEIKKEKPKKVVKKKAKPTQQRSALKSTKKQRSSAHKKNLFLAKVRDRINKHKTYPRIAKRRGMQGSVKVSFTILANGCVSGISVSGSKAFHSSAKNAVQKAFPISVKQAPITLPKTVSVVLNYKLRQ